MMGRKQDDVFVLGEESLLDEATEARDSGPVSIEEEGPSGQLPLPGVSASGGSTPASASASRRLAVLALGAGAAALSAGLVISAKTGSHDAPTQPQASSVRRSPSAAIAGNAAPPVSAVPRRSLDPGPRPKRPRRQPRPRPRGEPQRETTTDSAPVSSPVDVVAVVTDPPPTPVAPPLPPSEPSPPRGEGASGGRGEFGLER